MAQLPRSSSHTASELALTARYALLWVGLLIADPGRRPQKTQLVLKSPGFSADASSKNPGRLEKAGFFQDGVPKKTGTGGASSKNPDASSKNPEGLFRC